MSRILLIDADSGERLIVRSRLLERGMSVSLADTGAQGLVEARESDHDLVLVAADLGAGVSAAEVCRRLKAVPHLNRIPIVAYASKTTGPEVAERMYDAGCDAFLGKTSMATLDRVVDVLLRVKSRNDELTDQNRSLELENRRLDEERQQTADLEVGASDSGHASLVFRELAAGRPDGVLVVDGGGTVRQADRGARELFGGQLVGSRLGKLAPASGLEAFVRDARTAAREGFRFDVSVRRDRSGRSLIASVLPVASSEPDDVDDLRVVLFLDVAKRRVAEEMLHAQEPGIPRQQLGTLIEAARAIFTPDAIIGDSAASQALARDVSAVAGSETGHLLILGERGAGKELVARIVHYAGLATGSFLELRCSSLSPESIENELFGYAKGATPGAIADRPGLLSLAQDGTLFIDEVGDLPLPLQEQLLEVIETGRQRRRGSSRLESIECRFVASSRHDVAQLVEAGTFVRGLYDRLRTHTVPVPPLRERVGDVRALSAVFLDRVGPRHGVSAISEQAAWVMDQYEWPGNVAELEQCVEEACRRAEQVVEVTDLPRALRELFGELPDRELIPAVRPALQLVTAEPARAFAHSGGESDLVGGQLEGIGLVVGDQKDWEITDEDPISLELYEKKALLRALDCCEGDKLAAARLLNVGKSTLYRKLKKFGIS